MKISLRITLAAAAGLMLIASGSNSFAGNGPSVASPGFRVHPSGGGSSLPAPGRTVTSGKTMPGSTSKPVPNKQ